MSDRRGELITVALSDASSEEDAVNEYEQKLSGRFAGMARELSAAGDVAQTLQRIVELAVAMLEGCDHAGISLIVGDQVQTTAQSDDTPERIDRIQIETSEGPYWDAIREHEVFSSGDLSQEQRWSRFTAEVVEQTGVRSMLTIRLFAHGDTAGALNLYARTAGAFADEDRTVATIFAAHAGIALGSAQQQGRLNEEIDGSDVDVIGQAKGLIMEHQGVDEPRALELLRGVSRRMNRELRDVAQRMVKREHER